MTKLYFAHCLSDAEEFYTIESVTYASDLNTLRADVFDFMRSSVEFFQSVYGEYFNVADLTHMAESSELSLDVDVIEENPHIVWERILRHMKRLEETPWSHDTSQISHTVDFVVGYLDSVLCDVPYRCNVHVEISDGEAFASYILPLLMKQAQMQKNEILSERARDVLKQIETWGWKANELQLGRLMEWSDLYNLLSDFS